MNARPHRAITALNQHPYTEFKEPKKTSTTTEGVTDSSRSGRPWWRPRKAGEHRARGAQLGGWVKSWVPCG
jgi:hypothetical protein